MAQRHTQQLTPEFRKGLFFDEGVILDEDSSDVLHDVEGLVEVEDFGGVEGGLVMLVIIVRHESQYLKASLGDQV